MEEAFVQTLKQRGKYVTDDRIKLFRHIQKHEAPLSIQQIVTDLSGSMDEVTVYRNIRTFEQLNIVARVYSGWKYKIELSDQYSHHHHHMTCTGCGMIISFHESEIFLQELEKLDKKYNFVTQSHSLELKGLCQNCC